MLTKNSCRMINLYKTAQGHVQYKLILLEILFGKLLRVRHKDNDGNDHEVYDTERK